MLLFFIVLFSGITVKSQSDKGLGDRLYFGGGFGLSSRNNISYFNLSPQLGYKITDPFSVGIGAVYQYTVNQIQGTLFILYGGNLFSRYVIVKNFFATTEYEILAFRDQPDIWNTGFKSWFVGGGYSYPIRGNVSFNATGLYNLLWNRSNGYTLYGSPFNLRVGLNVGF